MPRRLLGSSVWLREQGPEIPWTWVTSLFWQWLWAQGCLWLKGLSNITGLTASWERPSACPELYGFCTEPVLSFQFIHTPSGKEPPPRAQHHANAPLSPAPSSHFYVFSSLLFHVQTTRTSDLVSQSSCQSCFYLTPSFLKMYVAASGITCNMQALVSWLGIKPGPAALGVWSLNLWTTREVL